MFLSEIVHTKEQNCTFLILENKKRIFPLIVPPQNNIKIHIITLGIRMSISFFLFFIIYDIQNQNLINEQYLPLEHQVLLIYHRFPFYEVS